MSSSNFFKSSKAFWKRAPSNKMFSTSVLSMDFRWHWLSRIWGRKRTGLEDGIFNVEMRQCLKRPLHWYLKMSAGSLENRVGFQASPICLHIINATLVHYSTNSIVSWLFYFFENLCLKRTNCEIVDISFSFNVRDWVLVKQGFLCLP